MITHDIHVYAIFTSALLKIICTIKSYCLLLIQKRLTTVFTYPNIKPYITCLKEKSMIYQTNKSGNFVFVQKNLFLLWK